MEVPFTYEHMRPLTMAPQFMISPQPGSLWSSLMLEQLADSSVWHAGLQWRDMGVFWCLRNPRLASSFDSPSLRACASSSTSWPCFGGMPFVCFVVSSAASTVGFDWRAFLMSFGYCRALTFRPGVQVGLDLSSVGFGFPSLLSSVCLTVNRA
ncbi:hypothetical protein BJV77DRAFT_53465 [Russula vinacea]|nr:hypothetical protein BJV77DRAFT_53465 [Russula vinacea]